MAVHDIFKPVLVLYTTRPGSGAPANDGSPPLPKSTSSESFLEDPWRPRTEAETDIQVLEFAARQ